MFWDLINRLENIANMHREHDPQIAGLVLNGVVARYWHNQ